MRKIFIHTLFVIYIFSTEKSLAGSQGKILLKVENEIITNFEVKNKILTLLLLSNQELNQKNIDNYKKEVLNILIENKLKKIEVTKYNVKKDNSKVNSYIKSTAGDISLIKKKFSENNLSYELYYDELEIEFMWQKLIYELYKDKIDINEAQLNNELELFINKNAVIKEFRIAEIEAFFKDDNEYQKIILEIEQDIKDNGFEATALKFNKTSVSNNSDLGWINSKSLSPEIFNMLDKMKIGEITQPIKRQNTLILLKLTDKRLSKKEDLKINKLRNQILNKKKNEQFNLYSKSHLLKLKNNSLIEYK
tara:strand:- start:216 stop:1136 length:921 start_codon:yes stop_codon:yes gene_type:complete